MSEHVPKQSLSAGGQTSVGDSGGDSSGERKQLRDRVRGLSSLKQQQRALVPKDDVHCQDTFADQLAAIQGRLRLEQLAGDHLNMGFTTFMDVCSSRIEQLRAAARMAPSVLDFVFGLVATPLLNRAFKGGIRHLEKVNYVSSTTSSVLRQVSTESSAAAKVVTKLTSSGVSGAVKSGLGDEHADAEAFVTAMKDQSMVRVSEILHALGEMSDAGVLAIIEAFDPAQSPTSVYEAAIDGALERFRTYVQSVGEGHYAGSYESTERVVAAVDNTDRHALVRRTHVRRRFVADDISYALIEWIPAGKWSTLAAQRMSRVSIVRSVEVRARCGALRLSPGHIERFVEPEGGRYPMKRATEPEGDIKDWLQ